MVGLEELGTGDYSLDADYQLGANIDVTDTQDEDYNNGNGHSIINTTLYIMNYTSPMSIWYKSRREI